MAQSIRCPHCGKVYVMKPELAGKQVRCRQCEKPFVVPAAKLAGDDLEEPILLSVAPPSAPLATPPATPRSVAPAESPVYTPRPSASSFPAPKPSRPSRRSTPKVRSGFTEEGFVKLGLLVLTLGIIGTILPRFGLQFKIFTGAAKAAHHGAASAEQQWQSMAIGTLVFGISAGIVLGIGLRKDIGQAIGATVAAWLVFGIAFFLSPMSGAFGHDRSRQPTTKEMIDAITTADPFGRPPPPRSLPVEQPQISKIDLPKGANDPHDPDFYRINLAELQSGDGTHRAFAAMHLAKGEPKQLRSEITKALEAALLDGEVNVRDASLKALCIWSTNDIVPIAIRMLDDPDWTVFRTALDIVSTRKDPRAIEAAVALLGKSNRSAVAEYLKLMGSPAEESLLTQLEAADDSAKQNLIEVLGTVASEKGIAKLREIAGGDDFMSASAARQSLLMRGEDVAKLPLPGGLRGDFPDFVANRGAKDMAKQTGEALDPEQSDYFEKLAERLQSSDFFLRRKAVDLLLQADPDKAKVDTRKQIVRSFGGLVEELHGDDQRKAVQGLAQWGGKDSVPTLLNMLDSKDKFLHAEVLRSLGALQDERAAIPVAMLLNDFFDGDAALKCLRQMGSSAEEGLLKVVYSPDARICLATIDLMASAGTAKSLPALEKALQARNPDVRQAAKMAVQKIRQRERMQKEKEGESGGKASGKNRSVRG